MKPFCLSVISALVVFGFSACKKEAEPSYYPGEIKINFLGDAKAIFMTSFNPEKFAVAVKSWYSPFVETQLGMGVVNTAVNAKQLLQAHPVSNHGIVDFEFAINYDKRKRTNICVSSWQENNYSYAGMGELGPDLGTGGKGFTEYFAYQKITFTNVGILNNGYLACGYIDLGSHKDIILMYADQWMNRQWVKQYSAPADDAAIGAVQLCDGTIGVLAYTHSYGHGDRDIWFLKLDNKGDTIFTRTFGGNGLDNPSQMILEQCEMVVTGHTSRVGLSGDDGFVLKIDENGNKIWEKTYGTADKDVFNTIVRFPGPGFLAVGKTGTPGDIYVQAIDLDGNELWSRVYGDKSVDDNPVSVVADNVYYYLLNTKTDVSNRHSAIFIRDTLP